MIKCSGNGNGYHSVQQMVICRALLSIWAIIITNKAEGPSWSLTYKAMGYKIIFGNSKEVLFQVTENE